MRAALWRKVKGVVSMHLEIWRSRVKAGHLRLMEEAHARLTAEMVVNGRAAAICLLRHALAAMALGEQAAAFHEIKQNRKDDARLRALDRMSETARTMMKHTAAKEIRTFPWLTLALTLTLTLRGRVFAASCGVSKQDTGPGCCTHGGVRCSTMPPG